MAHWLRITSTERNKRMLNQVTKILWPIAIILLSLALFYGSLKSDHSAARKRDVIAGCKRTNDLRMAYNQRGLTLELLANIVSQFAADAAATRKASGQTATAYKYLAESNRAAKIKAVPVAIIPCEQVYSH
jgi:hypothetical protein